jgi:hypothetical protein
MDGCLLVNYKKAPQLFCLRRSPSKQLNVPGAADETMSSNVFVIGKIAARLEFHLRVPILIDQYVKTFSCVASVGRISKLMHNRRFLWFQGLAAAFVLVLMGCAGTGKDAPLNEQQLLVFSGFSLKLGYTQAALEEVGKLPQRRVVRIESQGQQIYVWADAAGCQCWYVGDQSAYQRLLELGWENKAE